MRTVAKLFLIALLPLPLIVTADSIKVNLLWDTYGWPTATIRGECKTGTGAYSPVGTVSAATSTMSATVTASKGDIITCRVMGELDGEVSAWSTEATYRIPLGLTPPVNVRVVP